LDSAERTERDFFLLLAEVDEALTAVGMHEVVHVASQLRYLLTILILDQAYRAVLSIIKPHGLQKVISEILLRSSYSYGLHHVHYLVVIVHAVHDFHLKFLSCLLGIIIPNPSNGLSKLIYLSLGNSVISVVHDSIGSLDDVFFVIVTDYAVAELVPIDWLLNWH
jgi:hypothetical protein